MVQVNSTPLNLRVRFSKTGRLAYISHLDLVRTMNKIIVRAKLPLWYTEGFNPKPKMVFAVPLSIGTESNVEFMDVRLTEKQDPDALLSSLNANSTAELVFLDAYYPETKLTLMKWMSYEIKIKTGGNLSELASLCERLLSAKPVEIIKKSKSGEEKTVDASDLIKSVSAVADGDIIRVNCVLCADQSTFLNPEHLIKTLKDQVGILNDECLVNEWYSIRRTGAFTEEMNEFR
ncbi:MAG: TIGR03936 family radical SAM-associated protein [Clostridia bacterium]|nr:TIGR03936 family radical SAM-associated protein [Clostridia bacterium]